MLAMTTKPDQSCYKNKFSFKRGKKNHYLPQSSNGVRGFRVECVWVCVTQCEVILYVCALTPGSFPTPRLWAWACFREPRCHLPPNSNGVVDQQLFTNRQEDGTNLITPYSLVSPSLETVSIWAPHTFSVAGRHKLILTALMNIVFHSSGREPGNNEVLTKSSVPQIT